jgi:DNA-binding NtrC family response regulator
MPVLLVIDDDAAILHGFRRLFREPKVTLLTAATAEEGLEMVAQRQPDALLLDVYLPDLSGLEAFRRIQQVDARIPVIFITGHGTTETAIEAMKLGAYDYLLKPLEPEQLLDLVARAFEVSRLMRVPALTEEQEPKTDTADVLVGRCPAMQEVYKAIGRVAAQDLTVLILGESGTGKELVARAIYQHSRRADKSFLAVNCAAIPETLLESELFGHEKGSFTGADRKRIGKFEQCSGGTLFLDEIGDMTPLTQAKILRVLQEQRFERVGGNEAIQTDVRIIAATNCDLDQLVTAGKFRKDLYYRLKGFTIALPPLRERDEDLPLLVDYFLKRLGGTLGKDVRTTAPETLQALRRHRWPGNVRELQGVLKQALVQATGPVLLPEFLPNLASGPGGSPDAGVKEATLDWERFLEERFQAGSQDLYAESLALMEKQLLTFVLKKTRGNQSRAAAVLGISRASLRGKIHSLGIKMEQSIWSGSDLPDA